MTDPLPIDDIKRRIRALHLRPGDMARISDVTATTIYKVLNGELVSRKTLVRLTEALLAEERAQLARLAALHPQTQD